jgi:hypothetical protein
MASSLMSSQHESLQLSSTLLLALLPSMDSSSLPTKRDKSGSAVAALRLGLPEAPLLCASVSEEHTKRDRSGQALTAAAAAPP